MNKLRLPDNVPKDIEVFLLQFDFSDDKKSHYALLSADEISRAKSFYRVEDRMRFAGTRMHLRLLLAERLRVEVSKIYFSCNKNGKPYCCLEPSSSPFPLPIYFNVSHSGNYALIALSDKRELGVDIEKHSSHFDIAALQKYLLSSAENYSFADNESDFYQYWTMKEAALKALGVGIADYLQEISVFLPTKTDIGAGNAHHFYSSHSQEINCSKLAVCPLSVPQGYTAALVWLSGEQGLLGKHIARKANENFKNF